MKEIKISMDMGEPMDKMMEEDDSMLDEFWLPLYEVKEELKIGETGSVNIPVEVMEIKGALVRFKKAGESNSPAPFSSSTIKDLRNKLPKAER